jgi:magnesium chelatase family protein
MQRSRYRGCAEYRTNADVPLYALERFCPMEEGARRVLERAQRTLGLSARTRRSIIQVARTIADLDQSPAIGPAHLAEAVQYRVPAGLGG